MENLKAVVSLGHEALGVNTNEQMNATKNAAKAKEGCAFSLEGNLASIIQFQPFLEMMRTLKKRTYCIMRLLEGIPRHLLRI